MLKRFIAPLILTLGMLLPSQATCSEMDGTLNILSRLIATTFVLGSNLLPQIANSNTPLVDDPIPSQNQLLQPIQHLGLLYVVNRADDVLYVIDPNQANRIIRKIPVGRGPNQPVVHNGRLYITESVGNRIIEINPINYNMRSVRVTGGHLGPPLSYGQYLLVPSSEDRLLYVIDISLADPIVHTIEVGHGAGAQQPYLYRNLLYVSNFADSTVSVIDPTRWERIRTIPVGHRPLQALGSYGLIFVVSSFDETLSIIQSETGEVRATINLGRHPERPVVHGQYLYIANHFGNTVDVLDPAQGFAIIQTIEVGRNPLEPLLHENLLFVSNEMDGTVSVIDTNQGNKVIETFKVGPFPQQAIFLNGKLYISNSLSHSMSVLSHKPDSQ